MWIEKCTYLPKELMNVPLLFFTREIPLSTRYESFEKPSIQSRTIFQLRFIFLVECRIKPCFRRPLRHLARSCIRSSHLLTVELNFLVGIEDLPRFNSSSYAYVLMAAQDLS